MNRLLKILCLAGIALYPMQTYAMNDAQSLQDILSKNPQVLEEVLKQNPEILNDAVLEVLRNNSELLIDIIQQGADSKRRNQLKVQWQEDVKVSKEVKLEGRPSRGSEDASVTIIAFSDFACTYCMQAAATIENLLKAYPDTRFVFKQYASESPAAQEASRWFLAALDIDEEKGWNFYALLFSNQKNFFSNPTATLKEVASQSGFLVKEIESTLKKNQKKYTDLMEEDLADGQKLGFVGTPYFLVNDLVIRGSLPLENFIDAYTFALENIKK